MKTEVIKIDTDNIDTLRLAHAAEVLKKRGLVVFPTETVYGLGANALDADAAKKIYAAKGRPSDNPLIVHISKLSMLDGIAKKITPLARKLMEKFWPGPITLVLEKTDKVPDTITGGLKTVAVRMPFHPVALELIEMAGVPVAAPSANISGKPSPTCAQDVLEDMDGRVDIIIDSEFSSVGVESTVVDATGDKLCILRPGGITLEMLQKIQEEVSLDPALNNLTDKDFVPRAPGMKYKHYSPKAQVIIIEGQAQKSAAKINELADKYEAQGKKVGIIATRQSLQYYKREVQDIGDRDKPETIAANLFHMLREMDRKNVDIILAEGIENKGIGMAVMNRLKKAAGYNIIKV